MIAACRLSYAPKIEAAVMCQRASRTLEGVALLFDLFDVDEFESSAFKRSLR